MVSPLWKACSEGDLEKARDLLREASSVDIELKDHTGATPLIEAIKNGHVEIVRILLDNGADPTNASSQGRPEQYTSDPAILELLNQAQSRMAHNSGVSAENTYQHEPSSDADKRYYAPPGAYPYYPTLNSAPPPLADGAAMYYPPPPPPPQGPGDSPAPGGLSNLPPLEIARFIPCRYFPACRYGSSCIFAHPQTPYFQGPMPPPTQYPPYDPSLGPQPYGPNYYAVPPPAFQQPSGVPHMTPISPPPGAPVVHGRSPSEVVSPAQNPFPPNGIPPLPYGPLPNSTYSHQGQVPVPMSVPPLHHQSAIAPPGPQSPSNMYNQPTLPAPMYNGQPDNNSPYPPPPPNVMIYPEINGDSKLPLPSSQNDGFASMSQPHRDGMSLSRRGGRRASFGGRKPACLFFPSGRCKNGDDCRFPHILPDGSGSQNAPYYPNRGGTRSRGHNPGNGFAAIDEKLGNMTIRDGSHAQHDATPRSGDSGNGSRPRFNQTPRNHHGGNVNGTQTNKRSAPVKQRVPNADEFPVLGGSTTPPTRNVNGLPNGAPTAAQVLQAPAPMKKESSQSSTRGTTPDSSGASPFKETNQDTTSVLSDVSTPPVTVSEQSQQAVNKLPVSFATAATSNSDMSKEVSVSA
ncbi:hypothetical protein AX17_000694 [Amanita inopinata Kibby_2008]|nr:hypothetical protein AX17_000694 [Amanita inopinata Kibby_2008]